MNLVRRIKWQNDTMGRTIFDTEKKGYNATYIVNNIYGWSLNAQSSQLDKLVCDSPVSKDVLLAAEKENQRSCLLLLPGKKSVYNWCLLLACIFKDLFVIHFHFMV